MNRSPKGHINITFVVGIPLVLGPTASMEDP